jgi:hypothetical protein
MRKLPDQIGSLGQPLSSTPALAYGKRGEIALEEAADG